MSGIPEWPVSIRKGKLNPAAGSGEQGAPGSGATIAIWESALDWPQNSMTVAGVGAAPQPPGIPFARVVLSLTASHDSGASGLVFSETLDGVNYDVISSYTYSAAGGQFTYDFLVRSPGGANVKIAYTNSANVLTSWRYALVGIVNDRNPGA